MSESKGKNNIFLFSPGGYGPYSRLEFWADHMEVGDDEDDWQDAADDYFDKNCRDVDYGCYYMEREQAEQLLETLKKLLEEK